MLSQWTEGDRVFFSQYTVLVNYSDMPNRFRLEGFGTLEAARERFAEACESVKGDSQGRRVLLCREDYDNHEDFERGLLCGFAELDSFRC